MYHNHGRIGTSLETIREILSQIYGQQNEIDMLVYKINGNPPPEKTPDNVNKPGEPESVAEKLDAIHSALFTMAKRNNDLQDYLKNAL